MMDYQKEALQYVLFSTSLVREQCLSELKEYYFSNLQYKVIYQSAIALNESSAPFTIENIGAVLVHNGYPKEASLVNTFVPPTIDFFDCLGAIKEDYNQFLLTGFVKRIQEQQAAKKQSWKILEWMNSAINKFEAPEVGALTAAQAVIETKNFVDVARNTDGVNGLDTGSDYLNDILGGICLHKLYMIGALPGMGKTAILVSLARNLVERNENVAILFFAFEPTANDINIRIASNITGYTRRKILGRNGPLTDYEKQRIDAAFASISQWPMKIVQELCTWDQMRYIIHSFIRETKKRVIVMIDHLRLMFTSEDNITMGMTRCSGDIIQFLKKDEVAFIIFSHLTENKDVKNRRPKGNDLKWAKALHEDAHVVWLPYRPEAAGLETFKHKGQTLDAKGRIVHIIDKNRDGSVGDVVQYCHIATNRFSDNEFTLGLQSADIEQPSSLVFSEGNNLENETPF